MLNQYDGFSRGIGNYGTDFKSGDWHCYVRGGSLDDTALTEKPPEPKGEDKPVDNAE